MNSLYPTVVADEYLDHNGDWGTFLCDILRDYEKDEVEIDGVRGNSIGLLLMALEIQVLRNLRIV